MNFNIRNLIIRLIDIFYREPNLIIKYYRQSCSKHTDNNDRYIFMVDGRVGHGGMFDRLKGLISVYAVAQAQHKDFRIHWTYPFCLEKYLEPNSYDWRIKDNDIVYHFPQSRPLFLYGECYAPVRLMKNRKRESHFYYGYNSLTEINARFGKKYDWGELYRELFKPTASLQQHLDFYQKEIGTSYVAVHTRFLNLLGDRNETAINPVLPHDKQLQLMQKATRAIRQIIDEHKTENFPSLRVMLASDSMIFIQYATKQIPSIYIVPGTVKHIDTSGKTDDSENIKLFTDYYLLAHAQKVYSLWHEGMWKSAFPEYAAKIGGVDFIRKTF